ncbi:XRE family transcriptional regulator [Hyphomicrobium sp.]|uniref:XRE family transcriptional regulator n=1 Tax=Hyphomicrobium sp. TaxID=82 RepID=UPI00356830F3
MIKAKSGVSRFGASSRRSASKSGHKIFATQIYERWNLDIDDSRRVVASQIIYSIRTKWGTAVAFEEATGISQTEISRIRHGKLARFSLDRLVRLLWMADPDVEVELRVNVVRKSRKRRVREKGQACTSRRASPTSSDDML